MFGKIVKRLLIRHTDPTESWQQWTEYHLMQDNTVLVKQCQADKDWQESGATVRQHVEQTTMDALPEDIRLQLEAAD
ncbi:MAG: hypothetical protein H6970_01285 [Gammaproteobacteria bacterium]|nr:hypothetical protein [Gammaproteobacteria bacterium]MCP5423691.1 hypothetical protein [Gammaproteobacteria bacterium]